jgi:hypothetical protein
VQRFEHEAVAAERDDDLGVGESSRAFRAASLSTETNAIFCVTRR